MEPISETSRAVSILCAKQEFNKVGLPQCSSRSLAQQLKEQVSFLEKWRPLWSSNCVEVFSKNLCHNLNPEWVCVLKDLPIEDLLQVPAGFSLDTWPASLQQFISTAQKLGLPRVTAEDNANQVSSLLECCGYSSHHSTPAGDDNNLRDRANSLLSNGETKPSCKPLSDGFGRECEKLKIPLFLKQGMSPKKQHEVQELAHLVALVARRTAATCVIDVGSGQGGLAQVLSIAYNLPVIAIETCSHNSKVANFRAQKANRVLKGKQATVFPHQQPCATTTMPVSDSLAHRIEKSCASSSASQGNLPRNVVATVTLANVVECMSAIVQPTSAAGEAPSQPVENSQSEHNRRQNGNNETQLQKEHQALRVVLVGLHACGDLTPAILTAFASWTEVVGVVSLGCCYNILTEQGRGHRGEDTNKKLHATTHPSDSSSGEIAGFPMSSILKAKGFFIGHGGRDLACQSADRWRTTDLELARQNFEVHAFRAMLQVLLGRQFPEMDLSKVRVGQLGKAARRRKQATLREQACASAAHGSSLQDSTEQKDHEEQVLTNVGQEDEDGAQQMRVTSRSEGREEASRQHHQHPPLPVCEEAEFPGFVEYVRTAYSRLDLVHSPEESLLHQVWINLAPRLHLVRIYWVLRAVLAPVLEALILVDRLLCLEERTGCIVAGTGLGLSDDDGVEAGAVDKDLKNSATSSNSEIPEGLVAAMILPVFQAQLSPRNLAVVGVRNNCHGN